MHPRPRWKPETAFEAMVVSEIGFSSMVLYHNSFVRSGRTCVMSDYKVIIYRASIDSFRCVEWQQLRTNSFDLLFLSDGQQFCLIKNRSAYLEFIQTIWTKSRMIMGRVEQHLVRGIQPPFSAQSWPILGPHKNRRRTSAKGLRIG